MCAAGVGDQAGSDIFFQLEQIMNFQHAALQAAGLNVLGQHIRRHFDNNEHRSLVFAERRGLHLREIVHRITLDRLMIETDAPYLLPRTLHPRPKSRRNEPRFLVEVLRVVAESLAMEEAEVARLTTENARRFFAID